MNTPTNNHNNKLWVCVYRTGGTVNFKWNAALPVDSEAKAIDVKKELERMGYPTYVYRYDLYLAIGGPETYE